MHPEKLGFEDCDLNSIFKVIDKETQTNVSNTIQNSESTSKSYKLPLPRELEKPEEGIIKVFSFCQIIQDPECPTSITIVRESVTEEVHSHSNTPDDEAFSNRYRYCKEVIKPYLRDYPPDCPDSGELLLRDAIITANEEFPEYPPCYEIPNPEAKIPDKPQDETKKSETSTPESKKPEESHPDKKPEGPRPESKKPEKPPIEKKPSDEISPEKSKKVEEKRERRHLVLCPNEKIPKICIQITDPQICQEILKKQKEQQEKEDKTSVAPTGAGGPKGSDDKREAEDSRPDKPKKHPCLRKSDKKPRPEDPGYKEKPPTESQKSSHPENPPILAPKQPKEEVCRPEKEEFQTKQKEKEYCPEDLYVPVICPPDDDDDDCACLCGVEQEDETQPPKPEKEIVVLPKQDKKPFKSDKTNKKDLPKSNKTGSPSGTESKPYPNKKDIPKSDKTGWPSDTDSKPCPYKKDLPQSDKTGRPSDTESKPFPNKKDTPKSNKTGWPSDTESKPCPYKKDLPQSDKTGRPSDTESKPCPYKKDLPQSDKTGRPSDTESKPCPYKKDLPQSDKTSRPSDTESKPCPYKKDLPQSDKTGRPSDTESKPCPYKKDLPQSDKTGRPSDTESKPCPYKKDLPQSDKPSRPSDTESKPCPYKKDLPQSDKTSRPSDTESKPSPNKKDTPKSDKTGMPSDAESKPCPNKKDLPPFPQRKDCLGKLLDSLNVKSKNDEACIRKPIPKKMDETAENTPNKKCVPRPKTPPTVAGLPVDRCIKESRSDRKLCKPKTSKCDIKKGQSGIGNESKGNSGKENGLKGESVRDDGRCYCGKEGVKGQTGKPNDPLNCKPVPGQSQPGQTQPVYDQKSSARPIPSKTSKVETCQSIDGKPVKTALEAHNETMATLKCAMEDFMCKVFRSTQDAVTLITTESAKQLDKLRKSSSNTKCPPPKKVSDTRNNTDNLRRFSVVNIDSSSKDLPDCVPPVKNEDSNGPSRFIDQLVKKVDSALSIISDTLVFEMPKPIKPSTFNDTSSQYDIPVSSRPMPKDVENVVIPPASSSMFSTIKDTLWSMFYDDENSDKSSISKASSVNSASSESDEDLLDKLID